MLQQNLPPLLFPDQHRGPPASTRGGLAIDETFPSKVVESNCPTLRAVEPTEVGDGVTLLLNQVESATERCLDLADPVESPRREDHRASLVDQRPDPLPPLAGQRRLIFLEELLGCIGPRHRYQMIRGH